MSKTIYLFRHAPQEGPGYVATFLQRHDLPHRLIRIDQNEAIPPSLDDARALIFMGGPMSVNDPLPWIPKVVALIQQAVAAGIPVLGHCLGGQLLSKALGGVVTKNPTKEIGWFPVRVVDSTAARDWLDGLPREFEVFHWHGETFSIPAGATRILESRDCPNQAFVLDKHLALQCHVEMTPELVRAWADDSADSLTPACASVQSPSQMTADLEARVRRLQAIADKLYERWIQGLA